MRPLTNVGNTGWVAGGCRGEGWGLGVRKETLITLGYDKLEYALDAVEGTLIGENPKTNVPHLTVLHAANFN